MTPVDGRRRKVVAWSGAALGALALAPGVTLLQLAPAKAARSGAATAVRYGMLIDTERCTRGCDACVTACRDENGLPAPARDTDPQWIRKVEVAERGGRTHSLPVMCQHCARPPCVDVCPTGASFRRADGIVLVDRHACIGCRYCVMACPYKARSFVHTPVHGQKPDVPRGKGTAEGCTLCVHRVDGGREPACVEACRAAGHDAIVFGDLDDPESAIAQRIAAQPGVQIRADLQLDPAVRYRGL